MVVEHPRYFSIYSSGKPAPGDDTSDAREGSPALPPSPLHPRHPPGLAAIRARFPALLDGWALMENAGGSQAPASVSDAVRQHMRRSFCQLGAGYPASDRAVAVVDSAHAVLKTIMGVEPTPFGTGGEVILGGSSTQLLTTLAACFRDSDFLLPGDDVVIHRASHEANVGPWVRLAERRGATVRWWGFHTDDRDAADPGSLDALREALTPRTKIVAACHASNLLGAVVNLPAAVGIIREAASSACQIIVDGVAYAPHRAMSVSDWGVDWYCFSPYKTFGPHAGALFGSDRGLAAVKGPNHYFVDPRDNPYKHELGGGLAHELCAGIVAMGGYLRWLSGAAGEEQGEEETRGDDDFGLEGGRALNRADVLVAFDRVRALEEAPARRAMEALVSLRDRWAIRILGPACSDATVRVPTMSFFPTSANVSPSDVAAAAREDSVAIRNGNMYGVRLCEDLGIEAGEGVVRVSLAHYNTEDEVERLVLALERVFAE